MLVVPIYRLHHYFYMNSIAHTFLYIMFFMKLLFIVIPTIKLIIISRNKTDAYNILTHSLDWIFSRIYLTYSTHILSFER